MENYRFDNVTITDDDLFSQLVNQPKIDAISNEVDELKKKWIDVSDLIVTLDEAITAADETLTLAN